MRYLILLLGLRRANQLKVMHFILLRNDVAARHPWLPRAIYDAFLEAKEQLASYYSDPNWSSMVWAPHYRSEEAALLGDPWQHGFGTNRTNIERFTQYSFEQGLISAPMAPERLFHESVLDT